MRPPAKLIAAFGLVLLSSACATAVSVATDFDHAADFSKYRTYQLIGGHIVVNGVLDDGNTLVKDRINIALAGALKAKGLAQVQPGDTTAPDLIVGYVAGARRRTEIEGMGPYSPGVGPYWNAGWWSPGYMDWWARSYDEGTLVIDLVDGASKRLVWRAYARAEVNAPVTDEKVRVAVDKAFKNYPPGK
jgi:hypothetical protein